MKALFIAAVLCAGNAFAATTTKMQTTTTTNTTASAAPAIFVAPASDKRVYFTTNVVDISKGAGNIGVDFFINEKVSASFNVRSSSEREKVKHVDYQGGEAKVSVDRTGYGLGATYWVFGNEAKTNILVNPYLAFGTKKHPVDTETQSGFGLKVSGLFHLTREFGVEAGIKGDSLDDGALKGNLYAGLGYMF